MSEALNTLTQVMAYGNVSKFVGFVHSASLKKIKSGSISLLFSPFSSFLTFNICQYVRIFIIKNMKIFIYENIHICKLP